MALYAIGDVQGCREALEDLLEVIRFDPAADRLWLAGDLVARGPDSLGVLRLVKGLGTCAETVLGNHDLHLLAAHHGISTPKPKDRTQPILEAPDREALMDWLRQRPLLLQDAAHDCVLTHAGIPPMWSLATAQQLAREVEATLQGTGIRDYLAAMYGNEPALWSPTLAGTTRLRVITNYLTRMRLLSADGALDLAFKEDIASIPAGLHAWFELPNRHLTVGTVLFGHWAALEGHTGNSRFVALDSGCVWGRHLTAFRLDDGAFFRSRRGCPQR
ncbi:MAG: bis(5-nucleosyl)-tetraphosphatase, symmetrical [Moraxellaceae bacterium]|jgi:bis(5'-nucleosyl)-tetraphosphatase (symmetrical)|nr:bis(5-nucleosyl)-tetraphosphatase, symmetrical [Moraxellaceae bacterium]